MSVAKCLGIYPVQPLEARDNPSATVTTTEDYDPALYNPGNKSTFIVGSFRYAVQFAIEQWVSSTKNAGPITFDESINFNPDKTGVPSYFGGPITEFNTIKLEYGEISIRDVFGAVPFESLEIHAPKYLDPAKHHVKIEHTGTKSTQLLDSSVFDIHLQRNPTYGPNKLSTYTEADFDHVIRIGGLQITGGEETIGAGIHVAGHTTLVIDTCDIASNHSVSSFGEAAGAGLYIGPPISEDSSKLGPRVTVIDSLIADNQTSTFVDEPFPSIFAPVDKGGGIFACEYSELTILDSTVTYNRADNAGGGIYFSGGMLFDYPIPVYDPILDKLDVDFDFGTWPLYSSRLDIQSSVISANSVTSEAGVNESTGGGLVIAGETGAVIADTTFNDNFAPDKGGAVHLTGFADGNVTPVLDYGKFIGNVEFIATSLHGNTTGLFVDGKTDPIPGFGGAFAIDGIVNHYRISNTTVSNNGTVHGVGGGVWHQNGPLTYHFPEVYGNYFTVDVNARTMGIANPFGVIGIPGGYAPIAGLTRLEIDNATLTENTANGTTTDSASGHGGGLAIGPDYPLLIDDTVIMNSTIVAQNKLNPVTGFGTDLYSAAGGGYKMSGDSNLIGIANDGGLTVNGQTGTLLTPLDAKLLPLRDYGGPTLTHALRASSPAIDRGINPLLFDYDQRGAFFHRDVDLIENPPFPDITDVGAYEGQEGVVTVDYITWADAKDSISVPNTPSRITRIELLFSQEIVITSPAVNDAFSLAHLDLKGTVTHTAVLSPDATMMTLTFTGTYTETDDAYHSLIDGNYQLKAFAASIVSAFGDPLDGNKDGTGGDDFQTPATGDDVLYRFFGDGVITFRAVDFADFLAFRNATGTNNPIYDFDGNGVIDFADFLAFRSRFGTTLPSP